MSLEEWQYGWVHTCIISHLAKANASPHYLCYSPTPAEAVLFNSSMAAPVQAWNTEALVSEHQTAVKPAELHKQSCLAAPIVFINMFLIVFVYVHPTASVKYLSKNETLQLEQQQYKTIIWSWYWHMSIHKDSTKKAVHVLIHMHAMGGQDPVICANPHVHVAGRVQASDSSI